MKLVILVKRRKNVRAWYHYLDPTELLGMGMDDQVDQVIREKSQSAIDLILRSQKGE